MVKYLVVDLSEDVLGGLVRRGVGLLELELVVAREVLVHLLGKLGVEGFGKGGGVIRLQKRERESEEGRASEIRQQLVVAHVQEARERREAFCDGAPRKRWQASACTQHREVCLPLSHFHSQSCFYCSHPFLLDFCCKTLL